jgi:multidrug efflux pump subunit AcrA (membrane-fusion protein)
MVDVDVRTRREAEAESAAITRAAEPTSPRFALRRGLRILPVLITLATVAVAVGVGRVMWEAYMGAPWTRDGTVRVCVVTMAPEISGRIVELPVKDNQFVHKGDLLMVIDPDRLQDCDQPQRGSGAAGPGQCSECRERVDAMARADHSRGYRRRETNLRKQFGCRAGTVSAGGGQAGTSTGEPPADRNSLYG